MFFIKFSKVGCLKIGNRLLFILKNIDVDLNLLRQTNINYLHYIFHSQGKDYLVALFWSVQFWFWFQLKVYLEIKIKSKFDTVWVRLFVILNFRYFRFFNSNLIQFITDDLYNFFMKKSYLKCHLHFKLNYYYKLYYI